MMAADKYDFLDNLEPHQKQWAIEKIKMFKALGVAVPYGMIQEQAKEIKKEDTVDPNLN